MGPRQPGNLWALPALVSEGGPLPVAGRRAWPPLHPWQEGLLRLQQATALKCEAEKEPFLSFKTSFKQVLDHLKYGEEIEKFLK